MSISEQIHAAAKAHNLSVHRLAKEAGIPPVVLHRLANGTRTGMHIATWQKLEPWLIKEGGRGAGECSPARAE